jgi:hypothetical protein
MGWDLFHLKRPFSFPIPAQMLSGPTPLFTDSAKSWCLKETNAKIVLKTCLLMMACLSVSSLVCLPCALLALHCMDKLCVFLLFFS